MLLTSAAESSVDSSQEALRVFARVRFLILEALAQTFST